MIERPSRWLVPVAALILAFRLWLSAAFPVTGDEAYFIYWGVAPDLGFYDHPPMVGWILHALLRVSADPWVLRLPSTLAPALIAGGMFLALRRFDEERAALAALAFLLLPISVWNVLVTTDTPLVLFSFFSALSFHAALERRRPGWYALAGVLLGAAFLSKYFAVLLGLAYIGCVLATPAAERDWRGLGVTVLCALPFAGVNLYWNYEHCWANLMFNLYNRHGDAGWSWRTPVLYLLAVLYVLSPPAIWRLLRERAAVASKLRERDFRYFVMVFALPFAVFALLSPVKQIGLHWLLSFVPFFFLAAAFVLSTSELRRTAAYLGVFSALHVAAIAAGTMIPLEKWKGSRFYDGIVYEFRIDDVLRHIQPYAADYRFAADGYSPAVVASYYSGLRAVRAGEGNPIEALHAHYF